MHRDKAHDPLAGLDDPTSLNAAAIKALSEGITHVGDSVAELPLRSYAAPFYESKSFGLPAYSLAQGPTLLLPFHAQRQRALIRVDGTGTVQVGTMDQLTAQAGYILKSGGGSEEFKTFERIFALNVDPANPATVSVWAEYAAR